MNYNIKYLNFDTIDSTNKWSKEHCNTFLKSHVYVVTSKIQTYGLGSHNRKWISSLGGMYVTICVPLLKEVININTITIIAALSSVDVFKKYNIKISIKWPNDLILNNKKIGGILSETIMTQFNGWLFIGIGINFNNNDIINIERPLFPPSSVKIETNATIKIDDFIKELVTTFLNKYYIWINNTLDYFINDFYNHNILQNKNIRLRIEDKIFNGKFHSISENGTLNLITDGSLKNCLYGDIISIE